MNATMQVISVIGIDREFVTVNVRGDRQYVSWEQLRAAAHQEDRALASVYADVLSEARRLSAIDRRIYVDIACPTDVAFCHSAYLTNVAGEFVSGRIVAADFGQDGWWDYAVRDAERAMSRLRQLGYEPVKAW